MHGGEQMRPRVEREGHQNVRVGNVVLEGTALPGREGISIAVKVSHQVAFAVAGHAMTKDQVVHASTDIDRIDLHVAVVSERGANIADGSVEQQLASQEATGCGAGDLSGCAQGAGLSRGRWKKQGRVASNDTAFD
jgi:hypothetical protein